MTLELAGFTRPEYGENRVAARAEEVLKELHAKGLLVGVHAISAELIMQLATAAGNQLAYGKPTIAAVTAVKQIAELLESLPVEADSDPAAQLMAELQELRKGD